MGFTLDSRSQDILARVDPDLARAVRRAASISPIRFRVIEGLRTLERQRQLKAQGLSKTLNSRHLTGHAVDIVPAVDLNGDGKITGDEMWHHSQLVKLAPFIRQGFEREGVPYEWGGDWRNAWDKPHWQLPWKRYPIRSASLHGDALDEAFADPVMETPPVTPAAARLIGESTAGAGGLTLLADTAAKLQEADSRLTAGTIIGTVVGGILLVVALASLWDKWDAAGRPMPRLLRRLAGRA